MNAIQIPLSPSYGSKVRDFVFQLFLTLFASILILNVVKADDADCTMSWNPENYVGIAAADPWDCVTTIRPEDILTNPENCIGDKTVTVFSPDDPNTPIDVDPNKEGAQLDETYIGMRLQVKVEHMSTGAMAIAYITLEDYTDPELVCEHQTINCFMDSRPVSKGGDVPDIIVKDCSEITSKIPNDIYTSIDCQSEDGSWYVGKIERTWIVTDKFGNSSECTQVIWINRIGVYSGPITAPPVVNLECSASNPPNVDPENTGYPVIDIQGVKYDLIPGHTGYCDLHVEMIDNQDDYDFCGAGYRIVRTWTITDHCYPESPHIVVQKIFVEDKTGPIITDCADQTVGTNNHQCSAVINIPAATITDECSNFTVSIITPFGVIEGNGGVVQNVPVGMHIFTYKAIDDCGNKTEKEIKITVIDDDAPNVVCDQFTVVPLGIDGTSKVHAISFDDGSTDNCEIVKYEVSRMESVCGSATEFADKVVFTCCDLDSGPVMVALRVTDAAGNYNICMIEVTVQDKIAPLITCPANKEIDCTIDYKNTNVTGVPYAEDNCILDTVYFEDITDLNNCGWGTVTRKWIAVDKSGNIAECYQTITIGGQDPFLETDITWPNNYTATECGASIHPDNLPSEFARPILNTNSCDNIVTDFYDLAIGDDGGAACYVIHRKWTVTDLCVFDPNVEMSEGQWTWIQEIFINDNTDPIFIKGHEDQEITVDGYCREIPYTIMAEVEDCSPNLTYYYQVDLSGDGSIDFDGMGQMTELIFTSGEHKVSWRVTDGCGNEATAMQILNFKDTKAPTPALKALFVGLMPVTGGGMIDIVAKDFNNSSSDNCTPIGWLRYAYSEDVQDTVRTFTCSDVIGLQTLDIYVFDSEGNFAYATTYVDIQDQNDVCPAIMANVSGMITTAEGEEISDVVVNLEGGNWDPFMTDINGLFSFSSVPTGSYMLKPSKDVEAMNGVSTYDMVLMQRHILGLTEFSDPYTIIAADVNKSGSISTSDMVAMRRLILNIHEDFGSNQSWRFVHADYDFTGADILTQDFPEAYELNDANGNMEIDFIGIKVGDLNASADPVGLLGDNNINASPLRLILEDVELIAGETISIPIQAKDFNDVIAFQYTVEFDPSAITIEDITSGVIEMSGENHNLSNLENGAFASNWLNALPVSVDDDETLFTLNFKVNKNTQLSSVIALGNSMTTTESYRQSSLSSPVQTGTVVLEFKNRPIDQVYVLSQNMPNPFRNSTTIQVHVPSASQGTLSIYDLTGKNIYRVDQHFDSGSNEIVISSDDLHSDGIYYYKLSVNDYTDTRKMILIRQ